MKQVQKNCLQRQQHQKNVCIDEVSIPLQKNNGPSLITYSFVLYLQHGRHDVKCKPPITLMQVSKVPERNQPTIRVVAVVVLLGLRYGLYTHHIKTQFKNRLV